MSKVLVCYKWVKNESDLRVNTDLEVDFSKASMKISDYDKNAIEACSLAAKKLSASAVGLSCGPEETKKSFHDALARGLDSGIWVNTEGLEDLDSLVCSKALAGAVQKQADVSLVICAEGSSDNYARQTAPRIGAELDWPTITSVCRMDIEGNTLTAVRKMTDCLQTVKVQLPAVVAVLPEINSAPIPGLKAVMAAKKKTVEEFSLTDLGIIQQTNLKVRETKGYVSDRKKVILTGDSKEEIVAALVGSLRKEGVL